MEQMDVDLDVKAGSSTNLHTAGESSGKSKGNSGVSSGQNVMADASSVPSVTISLHPLVIMNISEHWTRIRAQAGEACKVYGALIGKQKGRNIEVMNSFELKTDIIEEDVFINRDYYMTKEHQYKQVSFNNAILGTIHFDHSK